MEGISSIPFSLFLALICAGGLALPMWVIGQMFFGGPPEPFVVASAGVAAFAGLVGMDAARRRRILERRIAYLEDQLAKLG
jgi:hypothetical protein